MYGIWYSTKPAICGMLTSMSENCMRKTRSAGFDEILLKKVPFTGHPTAELRSLTRDKHGRHDQTIRGAGVRLEGLIYVYEILHRKREC